MNEVKYSADELVIINEYNIIIDKKTASWSDDKYSQIRKKIKDHYLTQQNYTCFFCRQRIVVRNNRAWDVEHIISKSTHPNFMFEPTNLCITCADCNNEKRDKGVLDRESRVRFPKKSSAYRIIHPHFDDYSKHLEVIVEGELYKIKSPKGRYTYRAYGLDRFLMDTGISREGNRNDKLKKLLQSALIGTKDFEIYENEILVELLLRKSKSIGAETALELIKNLRQ